MPVNPITLKLTRGDSVYALPSLTKSFSGGNNIAKVSVAKLANAGVGILYGGRILPSSLDNTQAVKFVAYLSSPVAGAAGEKLRLEVGYHVAGDAESADPASWTQVLASSPAVNTWLAKTKNKVEWTLTSTNFVAAKHLEFYLKRDPTHVDDNHAQDIFVHDFHMLATY